MKWSVLKELLEKYYAGTSSEDEEKELRILLEQEDLPSGYSEDRMLIIGMSGNKEIPEPSDDLNDRIMSAIDDSEKHKDILPGRRRIYSIISVAATILIIIGFWFVLEDKGRYKDTYTDPQLAYNETVEVLYRISANLNRGRDQLEELSLIERTHSRLNLIPESRDAVAGELRALKYIENSIEMLGGDEKNKE